VPLLQPRAEEHGKAKKAAQGDTARARCL